MRVVHLPRYDRILDELSDTDIFVGFSLRLEQFALARKLKWLHSTAAGVGQLMYPELRKSGIEVTNASGVHRIPMAEHILGTLIALARRFPDSLRYQQQGRWAQQELWNAPVRPRELRGQILLFIGFGAIGREVAKIIRPLGMR
ncbi:MAG: NAD(P)-dependent oxidoreductase, partial [Candidatus Acidiferrales bacterium]